MIRFSQASAVRGLTTVRFLTVLTLALLLAGASSAQVAVRGELVYTMAGEPIEDLLGAGLATGTLIAGQRRQALVVRHTAPQPGRHAFLGDRPQGARHATLAEQSPVADSREAKAVPADPGRDHRVVQEGTTNLPQVQDPHQMAFAMRGLHCLDRKTSKSCSCSTNVAIALPFHQKVLTGFQ